NDKDWLGEITVRHLATMTAGFDDGRPPKLVYRPGTKGIYSNDTSNMLAELLTLRYGEDLPAVPKREVLAPHGVPAAGARVADEPVPAEGGRRNHQPRVRLGPDHHPPRARPHRLPVPPRGSVEGQTNPEPRIRKDRDHADETARPVAVLRLLLGEQRER